MFRKEHSVRMMTTASMNYGRIDFRRIHFNRRY